jgi:hypothetical protein
LLDKSPEARSIPQKPPLTASGAVSEVFHFWRETMGKNSNTALGPKRKRAIEGRLKDGYTVEDIRTAILGCSWSPHNMGQNEHGSLYNDIELICRDETKLERFIEIGRCGQIVRKPKPADNLSAGNNLMDPNDTSWEKPVTFAVLVATHDAMPPEQFADRAGYEVWKSEWLAGHPQDEEQVYEYERSARFGQRFGEARPQSA